MRLDEILQQAAMQLIKAQSDRTLPCGGLLHPKFTKLMKKETKKWKSLLMYSQKSHAL